MKNKQSKKHPLMTLAEAARRYGFSRHHLGNLVRRGRLNAYKTFGIWLTTPHDVETFLAGHTQSRSDA